MDEPCTLTPPTRAHRTPTPAATPGWRARPSPGSRRDGSQRFPSPLFLVSHRAQVLPVRTGARCRARRLLVSGRARESAGIRRATSPGRARLARGSEPGAKPPPRPAPRSRRRDPPGAAAGPRRPRSRARPRPAWPRPPAQPTGPAAPGAPAGGVGVAPVTVDPEQRVWCCTAGTAPCTWHSPCTRISHTHPASRTLHTPCITDTPHPHCTPPAHSHCTPPCTLHTPCTPHASPCTLQLLQKLSCSPKTTTKPQLPALAIQLNHDPRSIPVGFISHSLFCYSCITEPSPRPWPRSPGSGCQLPRATEAAASGIELSAAPAGALDLPPVQRSLSFFLFLWKEVNLSLS